MTPDPAWVRRTGHALEPDPARVVSTLFLPGQEGSAAGSSRSSGVLDRVLALSDQQVDDELVALTTAFEHRHRALSATWRVNFGLVAHRLATTVSLSEQRRLLIGAYFTQEFAIEGAGLLNPSMVAHPDQTGLPHGATRFVMTLRAIGEGHLSSVEFRTGVIDAADVVTLDAPPGVSVTAAPKDAGFSRTAFAHQLKGIGDERVGDEVVSRTSVARRPQGIRGGRAGDEVTADADFVLSCLPLDFTKADLHRAIARLEEQHLTRGATGPTAERFERIVESTYAVEFPADSALQERVLMPRAPCESHGMEDVRMVRFVGPDGAVEHLGTYTAYDGHDISIQLLRTPDFDTFSTTPLSGPGAQNKGLALFPRLVGGRYVALSRADRENNAVTTSGDLLHWVHPVQIQAPARPWEIVQLGNCGPPIETERGWLVLTHGVGPMRTYSIGALLLDLDDPTRVVGWLEEPFLTPTEDERSGYVPNVVYSCGAMLHGRTIVLPYGCSDSTTRIALVDLDAVLEALRPR